jgi:hypothetical protein
MDQTTLLYIMAGAVCVSAIAIVIQLGILFGVYKAARGMQDQVAKIAPKAESLVDTAQRTVEESKKQILDITAKANQIIESTRGQMAKLEELVTDASGRARVQMDRIEMVMDDTVTRVQETVNLVHTGVMRPLRQVNGVAAGIRTAVAQLMRGGRPSVAQATSDEEMFI